MKPGRASVWCVGRALLAAWILGTVGCDGGGQFGVLTFEVAGPPGGMCGPREQGSVGSSTPCIVLRVFRRTGNSLEPIQVFRADADHGDLAQGAYELRFDSLEVKFDVRLPAEGPHDLHITAYTGDDWRPAYGARLEGVRLDQREIRVRLYPLRSWACPGWRADGTELAPRALHEAVRLPNGDVLLLGGVTGQGIDPAGAGRPGRVGALLQPVIEVYDADDHRFYPVQVVGGAFERALFDTIDMGEEGEGTGRYRVRVVGGLVLPESSRGTAVLEFDNRGTLSGNTYGLPFVPSAAAMPAATVDLVYDANARTLELDASPPSNPIPGTLGAAVVVSSARADGSRAILIGLTIGGGGWAPAGEYYATQPIGPRTLGARRLGATVDGIPALDQFFVWGGNVGATDVLGTAGELVRPNDPETRVLVPAVGLPRPVAFHTATRMRDGSVVVAGGVLVETDGVLSFSYPTGPDALHQLRFDPLTLAVTSTPVALPGGMTYTPTILHTATDVPDFGLVLVGGARVLGEDRLQPVATVARVVRSETGYELDDAVVDLAQARFGHSTTLLPGNRVLVTGGFTRSADGLQTLGSPEVMFVGPAPYESILAGTCVDRTDRPDAGQDAGPPPLPDAGPTPTDAGPDAGPEPDAGPPPPDGG